MDFRGPKKRGDETSNGMVCRSQQVSMHEVWEKQQTHEDARKMRRTKICQQILGNGESVTLEVMIWFEEWIDREMF